MTNNEQPCGFGEFLRSARQAKGLSLEQVSEQTKIPVSKLKELENEDLDQLPAAVFVKGFIKAYTATVGADAEEANKRFDDCINAHLSSNVTSSVEPPKKSSKFLLKLILSIAIIILLVFAVIRISTDFNFGIDDLPTIMTTNEQQDEQGPSVVPDAEDVPAILPGDDELDTELELETITTDNQPSIEFTADPNDDPAFVETDYPEQAIEDPGDIADVMPTVTKQLDGENEQVSEPISDISTGEASAIMSDSVQQVLDDSPPESQLPSGYEDMEETADNPEDLNTLSIEAIELTWLKYTIDEFQTKEITLRPGAKLILKAKKTITLFVGNAGGVKLKYNDQDIGIPGKPGQVLTIQLPKP